MQMKCFYQLIIILSLSVTTGCANFSAGNLFGHYSEQHEDVYQAVKYGDYTGAYDLQNNRDDGGILGNFEKGRIAFLAEDYPNSQKTLDESDNGVKALFARATVSATDSSQTVAAITVNDNLKDYHPADYELGFLHLYLGLNYLQRNDLEGAVIEMRRANQIQEAAKKAHAAELKDAQNNLKSNGFKPNIGSLLSNYPDAGKKLSAIQNGYLFYLSALLYHASDELNNAYVDLRRALTVAPDNPQVIQQTMLVAKNLGMSQDLRLLEKTYGEQHQLGYQQGRVIVIEELDVIQSLKGWRLDLPMTDSRGNIVLYSIALPHYEKESAALFSPLHLNDKKLSSSLLADINNMAKNDLYKRLPKMVIRQALRVWTKDQVRKEVTQNNVYANLALNIWNAVTEQPDTRNWQTLPAKVNTAARIVNAGEQMLKIGDKSYSFNVPAYQTTLVWVSRQGNNSTVWHKQLGRL